jgi:PhoPQ-activated pathogenicity-related protein
MTARNYDSRRFRASATLASLVVALAFLSASAILISQAQETALDRYVNSKDPVYGWKLIHTAHGGGYQAFVLELTSQTWRTAAEVDRPVWKQLADRRQAASNDEPHGDALHRRRQQRHSCAHHRRPAHD